MRPFTIALLTLTILGGDMAQSDPFGGGSSMFDPAPFASRSDAPKPWTPPLPVPRPKYKFGDDWMDRLRAGDVPEEFEAWSEEYHRLRMRDPEYRQLYEQELRAAEDFKKRYEGWIRDVMKALQPGQDI
jgi:hypothetical protein